MYNPAQPEYNWETFRQLYDFKHGARGGPDSAQMKPSVEKLSIRDMIFIAAYAASLAP